MHTSTSALVAATPTEVLPPHRETAISWPDEPRRTEEQFHLAALAAQDLIWDWDLVGGVVTWAGTTDPYFGLPPRVVNAQAGDHYRMWADRVHPEDLAGTQAASRAAISGGADSWEHEYRFRRGDGSYTVILERAYISRDPAGGAVRVVGAMRDVSARKEAERATTRLASIVASSTDAIVGKTLDGVVTSWNAAAERIFGYSEREMVGRSIFVLIPEELHGSERELLDRIRRGERVEFADAERIRKDGTRITIALTVSPIWDSCGLVSAPRPSSATSPTGSAPTPSWPGERSAIGRWCRPPRSIVWTAGSGGAVRRAPGFLGALHRSALEASFGHRMAGGGARRRSRSGQEGTGIAPARLAGSTRCGAGSGRRPRRSIVT